MVTGSLQIKKNNYYAVLNLIDSDGNKKQKWISTGYSTSGHNKRAAQKKLAELIDKYNDLPVILQVPEKITFVSYIKTWVDAAQFVYDPITYQGYKNCVDVHILPYFNKAPQLLVSDITPEMVQEFSTFLSKQGNKKTGGALSNKSVRNYLAILSQIFEDAKTKKKIVDNPCKSIKRPKKVKYKPNFYDTDQVRTLFEAVKDEPIAPMIIVTAVYGLRRSELLGLKFDSLDFTNKQVTIKHVVSRFSTVVEKDDTKTESSYRTYPMPPEIEQIFIDARERKERNKALFREQYVDNDYVFTWDDGRTYAPDYITRKFKQLLKKYNLPVIRLHDLRHSCASMLLEKGRNLKDVQSWLGHADISTTGNIYGHLTNKHLNSVGNELCKDLLY